MKIQQMSFDIGNVVGRFGGGYLSILALMKGAWKLLLLLTPVIYNLKRNMNV